jgi:molybdate transport repressor ModE-like protein
MACIQLLGLIGEHGSITRAAKAMGMSYRRARYLMDEFSFMSVPPIGRHHGGTGRVSAELTHFGAGTFSQGAGTEQAMVLPCLEVDQRACAHEIGAVEATHGG